MPKCVICNDMLIRFGCIICTFNLLGNETLNMYFMCLQRFYLAASLKNINIVRIKQPNKKSNSPTERRNQYKRNVWVAWSHWTRQRDKAVEKSMCQSRNSFCSQVWNNKWGLWGGDRRIWAPNKPQQTPFPAVLPQNGTVSASVMEIGATPGEWWLSLCRDRKILKCFEKEEGWKVMEIIHNLSTAWVRKWVLSANL